MKVRTGQLARLGGVLVEVIEVSGEWAKVRAFHKSQNQVPQDRLVADLRAS